MATSSGWRALQISCEDVPHLLVKTSFIPTGYTIYLSDLGRIWHESATRRDLVKRARKGRSSIDPEENDEQYQILLGKIKSALDQESNTTLKLSVESSDELVLRLSAPLPVPLPSFTWTINLSPSSTSTFADQLVTPLIQQANLLNRNISLLIAELHAKDKVISRITDRLEASGHDLTAVFPGTSGVKFRGKKSHAQQLAGHVAGLTEFDEKMWRARSAEQPIGKEVTREDLHRVLGSLPSTADARMERANGEDEWWRTVGSKGFDLNESSDDKKPTKDGEFNAQRPASRDADARDSMDIDQDSDEFQRQQTPPRLRQHTVKDPSLVGFGDQNSDSDGDDLDAPSQLTQKSQLTQRSQASQPSQRPPQPPTQDHHSGDDDDTTDPGTDFNEHPALQNPTRPKSPSPVAPSSPRQAPAAKKKLGTIGGRAAKTSPQPAEESAKPCPFPPKAQPPPKPKPRNKLGTIGGKRKPSPAPTTNHNITPPPPSSVAAKPISSPSKPKSKLGTIGGRKHANTKEDVEPETERASREPERLQQPNERETSQERADRKREELKRELEAKAMAPVKKKRKF